MKETIEKTQVKVGVKIETIFGVYEVIAINNNPDLKPIVCKGMDGKTYYFHYEAIEKIIHE